MATMAELITQVRRRADMENTIFVTDQELEDYLNDSISDLYTELMARWGDEFFVATELLTVSAGASDEVLVPSPITHPPLRFLAVRHMLTDGRIVPVGRFNYRDTVVDTTPVDWQTNPPRYRFSGMTSIDFERPPTTNQSLLILYVPAPIRYDKDVATEIRELYAWREYVIVDAMIKVAQKEESDTASLDARKQALLIRISANAPPRDAAQVSLIQDDRAFQTLEDWGWG